MNISDFKKVFEVILIQRKDRVFWLFKVSGERVGELIPVKELENWGYKIVSEPYYPRESKNQGFINRLENWVILYFSSDEEGDLNQKIGQDRVAINYYNIFHESDYPIKRSR